VNETRPNPRVQRTRPLASLGGSPLTRHPLGRAVNIAAIGLLLWSGCRQTESEEHLINPSEDEVLTAVLCGWLGPTAVVEGAQPARGRWTDAAVRQELRDLRRPTTARPAIDEDTIQGFLRTSEARPVATGAGVPTGAGIVPCREITFVSEQASDVPAVAVSRIGFNRRGDQALIYVNHRSGRSLGSSGYFLFLTKPLGRWVVVGVGPKTIA